MGNMGINHLSIKPQRERVVVRVRDRMQPLLVDFHPVNPNDPRSYLYSEPAGAGSSSSRLSRTI